jgi:succinate-acetate transporter protein
MFGGFFLGQAIYSFVTLSIASPMIGLPQTGATIFYSLWCGFTFLMWLPTFRISIAVSVFMLILVCLPHFTVARVRL